MKNHREELSEEIKEVLDQKDAQISELHERLGNLSAENLVLRMQVDELSTCLQEGVKLHGVE